MNGFRMLGLLRGLLVLLLAGGLVACGGGSEYDGSEPQARISIPDKFLTFFNRQGDLAAGSYTLVVATADPVGQAGSFSVSIERNDGSTVEVINGSWASSGGADPDPDCASGNRCYSFSLGEASGVSFTLNTTLDGVLYLVDSSGTDQLVASAGPSGDPGKALTLDFSESEIDETDFARAYYQAIDPENERDTAQKFWSLHRFDAPTPDVHVVFRDSKDLGYGRDMYLRSYPNPSDCGGQVIAFFVRNFSVQILEGFAYGPVNLQAAIAEDLQHHVGTNAIEFSRGRADVGDACSSEPSARFYTFEPDYDPVNAPHLRRDRVDLDARGLKAMPQPCISCHGGKLRPLDRFGRFVAMHAKDAIDPAATPPISNIGDTKARMQAFEVDTFEFSEDPGFRRQDYEDDLRLMNAAIYCTYPGSYGHPACDAHSPTGDPGTGGVAARDLVANPDEVGEWSGDFAREMLLGWYGDNGTNNALDQPGAAYDGSFVPNGWVPASGGAPVGADVLFTKVVGPNCFVCHGKRGNELGTERNDSGEGMDIDFSNWEKFISHADEIERLVYDEGKMPMGLLNFNNFWDDPEKPELLASFIAPYVNDAEGFEARRVGVDGEILRPGSRVVARAGPDRVTQPDTAITLNAQASLFADSYQWTLLSSPPDSEVRISRATAMRTDFEADTDGEYIVELTASSAENDSTVSDTLEIVVDSSLASSPRALAFYPDIATPLNDCATSCHADGVQDGVPVWWVQDSDQAAGVGTGVPASKADTPALGFYEQVMARVNLEVIEDSRIVKKPAGIHHYGGLTAINQGFDISRDVGDFDRRNYDLFVNWIAEGAVCGGTPEQCVR